MTKGYELREKTEIMSEKPRKTSNYCRLLIVYYELFYARTDECES